MSNNIKYYTIEQQLDHLQQKGLKIISKKNAVKYLKTIGYYKLINGYRKPFMIRIHNNDCESYKYCENTSIEDLYHLYEFDQNLKNLILKFISSIEIMIKNLMANLISSKYGIKETDYLKPNNFKPDKTSDRLKFEDIKAKILDNIDNQKSKHQSIIWYNTKYGFFPFWVVSNILTLGQISALYSKMIQPDQYEIAKEFKIMPKTLDGFLMVMQLFRNACAHNEIVYNFKTSRTFSPKELKYIYDAYKFEITPSGKYSRGSNDCFALIIIFKKLLSKSQFSEFIAQLKSLLLSLQKKIDEIKYQEVLQTMGIVDDLNIIKKL